jgi:excisionase family DNA binding protein
MEEIMTPSEVAALLKIHLKTVYKLAEKGVIPGNRIGRSWRFSRSDVQTMTRKREQWSASKFVSLSSPFFDVVQRWDARDPSQHLVVCLHERDGR